MTGARSERLAELVSQAQRHDGETLEHLTNRGLVRRAFKLTQTDPQLVEEDDSLRVVVGDLSVTFRWGEPLAQGSCACATAGVCQHVLAAIMVLRDRVDEATESDPSDDAPPGRTAPDPVDGTGIRTAISSLTDADLGAWAHKADRRWACERVVSLDPSAVTISTGANLSVQLPPPHGHVRFLGPSLDDTIVKPSGRHDRRVVTLAVLALWQAEGREPASSESSAEKPAELVAERRAVTERALRIAGDLLNIGLLHLGDSERERLDSLAASARGVKLYRLALLAERAADQVDALSELSTEADTGVLLEQLAEITAISEALDSRLAEAKALPDGLRGSARSRYEAVGQLELLGLGHYSWGDHRFAGTTGVFGQRHDRIYSVARPRVVNGRTLSDVAGWAGVGSVSALTGRQLTLANAQANDELRLSGTERTTATLGEPITPHDLDRLAWTGTIPRTPSRLLGRATSPWVVLRIDDEERPIAFDAIAQRTEWTLRSGRHPVVVGLPYRSTAATATATLEQLAAMHRPDFVVGRLRVTSSTLDLWPISAMVDGELVNLADALQGTSAASTASPPTEETAIDEPPPLERLHTRLVALADGGQRPTRNDQVNSIAAQADSWGLSVITAAIRNAPTDSMALLRADWIVQMIRDIDGEPN